MSDYIKSIKNIELSSLCNLSCEYCLSPHIKEHRSAGLMSFETFKKVVKAIEHFHKQGTQGEVWLHGTGESILNKDLVEMTRYLRERVPVDIGLSSNALLLNDALILSLKEAGITRIDISWHDEEVAKRVHEKVKDFGIDSTLNYGSRDRPFNWAGQLNIENTLKYKFNCPWISNKECVVLHDGSIVSCCFDAYGTNIIGSIEDEVGQLEIKRFELCENCNHTTN